MKRTFYCLAALALAVTCVSCIQDEDNNLTPNDQNLELRASTLGYTDGNTYKNRVLNQCADGNHENCDILADGTHRVCTNVQHTGIKHDGTHHNGTGHGGQFHDPATCTDATHNHTNCPYDPATCTDPTHNHGTGNGQPHDPATCTDKRHNHGTGNHGNNNGNHHK